MSSGIKLILSGGYTVFYPSSLVARYASACNKNTLILNGKLVGCKLFEEEIDRLLWCHIILCGAIGPYIYFYFFRFCDTTSTS